MSESPTPAKSAKSARRFHFSLRGILLLTLVCALGAERMRVEGDLLEGLYQAAWLAVSLLVMSGLCAQARDYWRASLKAELSSGQRGGLRFAGIWRAVVLVVFAAYLLADRFQLNDRPWGELLLFDLDVNYLLALVIALSTIRQLQRQPAESHGVWQIALLVLASIGGAALLGFALYDTFTIHFLVLVALMGVELTPSPISVPFIEGIDPDVIGRTKILFQLGILGAGLVPIMLVSFYLVLKTELRVTARIVAAFCFSLALAGLLLLDAWTIVYGLKQALPLIYVGGTQGDVASWLALGTFPSMTLVTCVAYRWSQGAGISPDVDSRLPYRNPYLHEQRWVAFLMLILAGAVIFANLTETSIPIAADMLPYLFVLAPYQLYVAIGILTVLAVFANWRRRHEIPPAMPHELQWGRFATAWIAVAAALVVSLPALALAGFALHLAQWHL